MSGMIRFLLSLVGCLWLCTASAGTIVVSGLLQDKLDLATYVERLPDPHNDLTLSAVYHSEQFTPLAGHKQMRPLQPAWFRFTVQNATEIPQSLIMDFDQALYSELRFYTIVHNVRQEIITGQDYAFSTRALNYHYFAFPLVLQPGESMEVYAHIDTAFLSLFTPFLIDESRFPFIVSSQALFTGGVIGVLGGILVFLLFYMALVFDVRRTGWIFVMASAALCSVLYIHGYIQEQLPELWINTGNVLYPVIHVVQAIALLQLMREHFQTSILFRKIDILLTVLTGVLISVLPLAAFINIHTLISVTLIMTSTTLTVSICSTLWMFAQNPRKYSVFALGLFALVLMSVIAILSGYGLIPAVPLVRYGYEIGLTLQVIILSLAVVSRIFTFQREKITIEAEMLKLNADLNARSDFVAKVSHDIKGPLAAVLGAEELLRDETDEALRTRYYNIINASSKMVIRIVDDILDYSRLQQGIVRTAHLPFDVRLVIEQIKQGIMMVYRNPAVAFHAGVSDDVPAVVLGDATRVSQVLSNLLNNALKFTAQGEVKLTVDLAGSTCDPSGHTVLLLRLTVSDTGAGMSPEFVQRAFDAYVREEEGAAGGVAGFGLGLAICKQLVDAMRGTIDIHSQKGRGSRIVVVLPVGMPETAAEPAAVA